jgi:hypothetical protein
MKLITLPLNHSVRCMMARNAWFCNAENFTFCNNILITSIATAHCPCEGLESPSSQVSHTYVHQTVHKVTSFGHTYPADAIPVNYTYGAHQRLL